MEEYVDTLNDEDFLKALEEAEYAGHSEQESGEEDLGASDDVSEEEGIEVAEDDESEADENEEKDDINEDTDHSEDSSEEDSDDVDTNEADDGELDDNTGEEDDTDGETDEENSQMDDSDTDTDTEQNDDENSGDTDEVDYKKQYDELLTKSTEAQVNTDKLQAFHDEVTSEFTANGKKVKGFTDPKKIIQSQQMAYGYSDKMATLKKYRPFIGSMKERGMLEDTEKFDLMMDLYDGNVEAIKSHIQKLDIDPVDLDMDKIAYDKGNHVTSNIQLALNDVLDNASNSGVKSEVERVVREQWDPDSVVELLGDAKASSDLVEHMRSGAFGAIQARIEENKLTDVSGMYAEKSDISKYKEALAELNSEYIAQQQSTQKIDAEKVEAEAKTDAVNAEKAKIETERKAKEYKAKAENEKLKADKARNKATVVSKKKSGTKTNKRVSDPMDLDDDAFASLVDGFIN